MIVNQARTLLLNRTGAGFTNRAGEEFIDSGFRKQESLPNYLSNTRSSLFGRNSDWLFENYRVRQYMALLHSTELVEFVTNLGSRITYDPTSNEMFRGVFKATSNKPGIHFVGSPPPPDDTGQSILRWKITVLDDATVNVEQITPALAARNVTCGAGIMPGLAIQFTPVPDAVWNVELRRRPQRSLGEIVSGLELSTAQYWNDLFRVGTKDENAEPWKTFRNLWFRHRQLPYRLGGLLLALIYGMEDRRSSG